ncbi:hsp70 family protein [Gigaspora margarita]|uniref:Hsp70 family protein n=1 Tax=Gigaspora margarita TaxID=4874 RepID=A0A8H4AUZ6_GIGMA|nr:hsp70 family protein [Gigaspora margarita]
MKMLSIFKDKEEKEEREEKEFTFKSGEIITCKKFEPDIKLKDVRKHLAKEQDNWKAEKLFFKRNGMLISHGEEVKYKLDELCDSDKFIYIENSLKEIKVHVDNEELTFFLDSKDKLKDIRKMFIEDGKLEKLFINGGNNENKKGFKFRWSSGKFVSDSEIDNNHLKDILVNENRIYISTLQKNKVTVYTGPREGPRRPFRRKLDKGAILSNIRKELENDFIEQTNACMCPECCFLDQDNLYISKSEENELILGEILSLKDCLNICCEQKHDHDLIKLINKCGYGFIIKGGEVKQAENRAFIIENKPEKYKFESKYEDNSFECKNEFYDLCDRNFISIGNVTSILPWVSVFFGIDHKASLEKLENYKKATKYSYSRVRKAKIDISKNNISATPEFIKAVRKALEGETRDKKVENLKKNIVEKYGYFCARSVYFGGIIVQKLEGEKYSNEHIKRDESNTAAKIGSEYVKATFGAGLKILNRNKATTSKTTHSYTIKGGDISKFELNNRSEWINSINDSEKWEIIEYQEILSIFSLLEENLQKEVLEVLGKRVLKAKVEIINYDENKKEHVHELSRQLKDIDNLKDCHIFTTVLKNNKSRHIFSSYVAYDPHNKQPIIIIKRAPSKNKPKKRFIPIRIGWMVVGYPKDIFDLELSNYIDIESEKRETHELNNQYIVDNISCAANLNSTMKYALTTCVIDNVEITALQKETSSTSASTSLTSNTDVFDSKIMVGSHIFPFRIQHVYLFTTLKSIKNI